jgi:hypothetical protein
VRWRADGKEIFYVGMDGRLVAVRIGYGPEGLIVDRPTPLFATRIGGALQGFNRHQYAVARDGQRFLMNTIAAEGASTITVIQNWAGARQ